MRKRIGILSISIVLVSIFFVGCSSVKGVLNQAFGEKVKVHATLTAKSNTKPSAEAYKVAEKTIDYRLECIGCTNRKINVDKSGNFTVDFIYNKDISDTAIQDDFSYATRIGIFTIQEVDEDKKGQSGDYLPTGKIIVTGKDIVESSIMKDQSDREQFDISITLNSSGSKVFEEVTERSIGKPLAIFIDDKLISAPTVLTKISGGRLMITNQRSLEEASRIVSAIKSGSLPFELEVTNVEINRANKK